MNLQGVKHSVLTSILLKNRGPVRTLGEQSYLRSTTDVEKICCEIHGLSSMEQLLGLYLLHYLRCHLCQKFHVLFFFKSRDYKAKETI